MNNTLKEKYMELIKREVYPDNKGMQDFIQKKISQVIETQQGDLIAFEKPSIETKFCFGYSLSRYDTESYDEANSMADYASKSAEYFKKENLKGFEDWLTALENDELYIVRHYYSSPADTKIKKLMHMKWYEIDRMSEERKKEYIPVTGKNKEIIREAFETEIAKFEKRLDAYLKKYGTSKLRTWTYWQDE